MANHNPLSSCESEDLPWSKKAAHCAVLDLIGQSLATLYQVPRDLPETMHTLVMQVNAAPEKNKRVA